MTGTWSAETDGGVESGAFASGRTEGGGVGSRRAGERRHDADDDDDGRWSTGSHQVSAFFNRSDRLIERRPIDPRRHLSVRKQQKIQFHIFLNFFFNSISHFLCLNSIFS